MGRIKLHKIHDSDEFSQNVAGEFKFVANDRDISEIYELLLSSTDIINPDRVSYLYGFGSQPKSVYRKLGKDTNEYDVLWFGYNGPNKYKVLSYISASTSGLLRIKDKQCLPNLLDTLSHLSMVGVFSCSKNHSQDFEREIINNVGKSFVQPENIIKRDMAFFYWVIDGDSFDEDQKGFLCQTAFGKNCPVSLTKISHFTNKKW